MPEGAGNIWDRSGTVCAACRQWLTTVACWRGRYEYVYSCASSVTGSLPFCSVADTLPLILRPGA